MSSFTDILKNSTCEQEGVSKIKKVQQKESYCPCAVKIATYGKAYQEVCNGKEVILHDGKAYYSCTRPRYEDIQTCWRHSTSKYTINYSSLLTSGGKILIEDNVYFDKHRQKTGKKDTTCSNSKNEFIIKINIKHKELIDAIQANVNEYYSNLKSSISKDVHEDVHEDVPFESSLTPDELEQATDVNDISSELIGKLIVDLDSNKDVKDYSVLKTESDSGSSDSDESGIEMDPIITKSKYGKRELAINRDDNQIYDPTDSELLGKLIIVNDIKSPILDDGNNCIVGMSIEIDGTEYMKCALSNRVYDTSSLELVGLGKEKDDGWMIKKIKNK
jgi:hypothetical protein